MLLENNPYPQDGRVRREAASLTAAGYRVTVICPTGDRQSRTELVDDVKVYRYPAPKERDGFVGYVIEYLYSMIMSALLTLYVFIRSGFDAIHAHNPPDTFFAIALWYKLFGVKFVFDHHDLSPEMYDARFAGQGHAAVRGMLLRLERLTFRVADHVVSTNASYKEIATGRGGLDGERVTIVRNGPDLERVRPLEPIPELRSRAGTILGYVGEMGEQDGVDYLIRSLHLLATDLDRTDFLCVIVGGGTAVPGLESLVVRLGLDERIWFTGPLWGDDLMRHLSAADICVDPDPSNPYNDRSTMIKMAEYMALEKPIVAFDLPEHRRTAGEAALYVTANDELEFARGIARLMDDPELRRTMGAHGRHRVETEMAWHHQERKLVQMYDGLIGRPVP
jgi:glycosyltransferase involved in cell wall biosynthesis